MKESYKTNLRILVVDDEPVVANICQRMLTTEGFKVDIASNGKIAQQMLQNNHYDYCMIDVRMPIMNGDDLYRWLQEENPSLANRVIFTSGDVINTSTRNFLAQNERPFLSKPFTPDDLINTVRQLVSNNHCFA